MPAYGSAITNAYMINHHVGTVLNFPVYPDEISDTLNATWQDQPITGRSLPITAYTGTSFRMVSFSVLLHREIPCATSIETILRHLRASVYPRYQSQGLMPPRTSFRFGDFYVRGVVTSVSFTWQKPIIDGKYHCCQVNISMNELPGNVPSSNDIIGRNSLNPGSITL